jgi:hypothetical protein
VKISHEPGTPYLTSALSALSTCIAVSEMSGNGLRCVFKSLHVDQHATDECTTPVIAPKGSLKCRSLVAFTQRGGCVLTVTAPPPSSDRTTNMAISSFGRYRCWRRRRTVPDSGTAVAEKASRHAGRLVGRGPRPRSRTHERTLNIQAFRHFTAQTRKCGGFAQEIENRILHRSPSGTLRQASRTATMTWLRTLTKIFALPEIQLNCPVVKMS